MNEQANTNKSRDEIDPYIVCRTEGGQFQCALWALDQGQRALALFLTSEAATKYKLEAGLGEDWQIERPARDEIVRLIQQTVAAGIPYAVLDPDGQGAKRIFDLEQVLRSFDTGE